MWLVSRLAELANNDGALACGNVPILRELLRASLPVPSGFVITARSSD
jgi:phosphoenolpyruvate synthase/pyruvate phosphate dikinase